MTSFLESKIVPAVVWRLPREKGVIVRNVVSVAVLAGILLSCGETDAVTLNRLTRGPSTEADPCFSPDGQQIVFLMDDNFTGNREIWTMSVSGERPPMQLTTQNLDPTWPTWSPDGSTIVFVARGALMKVSSSGGMPVRVALVQPSQRGDRHPTWSPDGSRIAFASGNPGNIWVVPATGGGASLLMDRTFPDEVDPSFSPDGSRIAFASDRSGHFEIYVQSISGGEAVRLTKMEGMNLEPAWSPDGEWIAFSRVYGPDQGIWMVPAAGGIPTCVTCTGFQDGTPNWSPDGLSLVFDRHVSDNNDDIWMATNLPLTPIVPAATTWGRVKAQFH